MSKISENFLENHLKEYTNKHKKTGGGITDFIKTGYEKVKDFFYF